MLHRHVDNCNIVSLSSTVFAILLLFTMYILFVSLLCLIYPYEAFSQYRPNYMRLEFPGTHFYDDYTLLERRNFLCECSVGAEISPGPWRKLKPELSILKDSRILTINGNIHDEVLVSREDVTLISESYGYMQRSFLNIFMRREDAGEYNCCLSYQGGVGGVHCISNPINITVNGYR